MRILIGIQLQGYKITYLLDHWNLSYLNWNYWNAVSIILIGNLKELMEMRRENCELLTIMDFNGRQIIS